jgi:hypothetical protein
MVSALFDQSFVITEIAYGEFFRQFSPGRLNEHSIYESRPTVSSEITFVNNMSSINTLVIHHLLSSIFRIALKVLLGSEVAQRLVRTICVTNLSELDRCLWLTGNTSIIWRQRNKEMT